MKKFLCLLLCVLLVLPAAALPEEAALKSGSRGSRVEQLQKRLNSLKLFFGTVDGIYGSQTENAVKKAQRALIAGGCADIEETGAADSRTLEYLFDENYRSVLMTLRPGSTGNRVKALQERLIDLGLLNGSADGQYGQRTEEAVLEFQRRMAELGVDLGQDGAASPELTDALNGDLRALGFKAPQFYDETTPGNLSPFELYAPSCILIDAPTGAVLFEKNADERRYPASTTKIMTLLVAMEAGGLDRTVTIPDCAGDVPQDSSLVPVTPGEEMTMRDLLYGLMIRSGNDAANAVAELTAGSIDAFVKRMNARAAELGMTGTHFCNPHGYHDENHYTTARDLAAVTRIGLTDPEFCRIVTCLRYTLPRTAKRGELVIKSTHEIFDADSPFYIPYAAGVKSGTTSAAGFCYVGAYQRGGRTFLAAVLGNSTREHAWTDLKRLFEYGMTLQ